MIGYRNMLCGMHVHVAVPDVDTRINLIMRLTAYLPLLLALTTSSPFWQGHLTGLVGYRLAAYDELPRTGLPELFRTNDDYREFVAALSWAKIIPDASYIWWAIRPSLNNPTIELRVADSCTRLEDAIAVAALFRCLVRALDRDRALNAGFDRVGRAISTREQVARPALRHRRHLRRTVLALTAHARAMARPGDRFHRRRRRRPRLHERDQTPPHYRSPRHQRRPPDRDLQKSHGRRPQKVNGAQGGYRLGCSRNAGAGKLQSFNLSTIRASPYPPGHL